MATTLAAAAAKSAAPGSVVARAVEQLPQVRTNVCSTERWLSLAGGGTLFVLGASGRTAPFFSTLLGGALVYRALSGNCPLYQALGLSTADATAENSVIAAGHGTKVEHTVVVNKPAKDVYNFWRDFDNLPRFMTHLIDVDATTDGQSHWIARGPLGMRVEWDAQIIADEPNRVISWKSLDGSDVDTAGSVHFKELVPNEVTEVRVVLKYDPPAGKLGTAVAKLIGMSPDAQIREDMRRFKEIVEAQPRVY